MAIETALGDSNKILSAIVERQWETFCSFTHTGFKQITRRYSGPILKPRYPEMEVIHALNFAGSIGLIAMIERRVTSPAINSKVDTKADTISFVNARNSLVGAPRFELGTPCTPCKCATRLRHAPTRFLLIV